MTRLQYISFVLAIMLLVSACVRQQATVYPKEARGNYTVEYVRIPTGCPASGNFISAYLLLPTDCPASGHPGIVLFHDHGARFTIGKEKMVRPLPLLASDGCNIRLQEEAQQWVDKFYGSMFIGDSLAAHGYAVLVPDALGWSERMFPSDSLPAFTDRLQGDSLKQLNKHIRNNQPQFYQKHLSETGEPWFETILSDDNTAFQWLAARPEVDAERIGVVGFSMGAYRAWNLAAENHAVSWCAAANWMTTLEANGGPTPNESAWSMYRPMLDSLDYPEIAARMTCPFLLLYGSEDPLFAEESVLHAAKKISGQPFTLKRIESAHRFTKEHWQAVIRFADEQTIR